MSDIGDLLEDLKQRRDELRVQVNLASKEIRDEWNELEEKMEELSGKAKKFAADAHVDDTREGLGKALGQLGREIKVGYGRIRDALREK